VYQFIAELKDTCGVCLQYHTMISYRWPIPYHHGCQCIQRRINPGQVALLPFCDFRSLLSAMNDDGKHAAIGRPNFALLSSGLATWEDIVTPSRVREFHEVMDCKQLTVEQMVMHGVDRLDADEAWALVHTPGSERLDRERSELLRKIATAGISAETVAKELSTKIAGRVGIGGGIEKKGEKQEQPSGPQMTEDEARRWMLSPSSDRMLKAEFEEHVTAALGPADAVKVSVRIIRDAKGQPSASFSCPADLREKLRRYILAVQGETPV
jgi:hypothetical protein